MQNSTLCAALGFSSPHRTKLENRKEVMNFAEYAR